MRERDVDDAQNGVWIVGDFRDWQIETPDTVGTHLLKGFDLDGDGQQRSKAAQVEVHTPIDDWAGDRPQAAGRCLDADCEQVLRDGSELRRAERASPVGTIWWMEAERIGQGHLPNANWPRAISFTE